MIEIQDTFSFDHNQSTIEKKTPQNEAKICNLTFLYTGIGLYRQTVDNVLQLWTRELHLIVSLMTH